MRYLSITLVILLTLSCKSIKPYLHFNNIANIDSTNKEVTVPHTAFTEPVIEINDILSINIQTVDYKNISVINDINSNGPTAAASQSTVSAAAAYNSLAFENTGFVVDARGFIKLPIMGNIHVKGLTIPQLKELLTEKARDLYKDPIVIVHFANFKISILGEVGKPGTYAINLEKFSLMDAINLAGDIQVTGQRNNILLMRETKNDGKIFVRLDLNDPNIFQSPYYYLTAGDVIYVEANKVKIRGANTDVTFGLYLSYAVSSISLFFTLYSVLHK